MLKTLIPNSIFLRIYTGLVLICAIVAVVFYLLFNGINIYRYKQYRESMATGAFYLVAAGVARQKDDYARQN